MNDEIRSATNTIAIWLTRKSLNKRTVTDDAVRAEIASRWPDLTSANIEQIIQALHKPGSGR